MQPSFGETLKHWRAVRRKSQLDLGLGANVSARHISFLETGRSNPSRNMVLHLCDELEVPRDERNRLLTAAGFAAAYRARKPDEKELEPVREAISWMLKNHDPYPAMVLDRHWRLVDANRTGHKMLDQFSISVGQSLVEALATRQDVQDAVLNLPEVAEHLRKRLLMESDYLGGDPILESAAERLVGLIGAFRPPEGPLPPFVPARYQFNGQELALLSTFSQFGTTEDIALADLKIEMMFPADAATKELLFALSQ